MTFIGMSEQGNAFKYAVLSTKVAQVLQKIIKNEPIVERETNVLSRGAKLLAIIIEGSTLVEGKEFTGGLLPTQEGLSVYGYALSSLSTMNTLEAIKRINEFTDFFKELLNEINEIKKGKVKKKEAEILIQFFLALGTSFRSDLKKERYSYPTEKHPLLRSASLNALFTT